MAQHLAIEHATAIRFALNVRTVHLTDHQFYRLCRDNPALRIELTADGELIVMSPTSPNTGRKNARILMRLSNWADQDGTGECFDSNSEFTLPNGAKRAPDGSWIPRSRWNRFTEEEKNRFTEICPDFVIELRSPSDRLRDIQAKMEEYIANGSRLGWLLDPVENRATIYRPAQPPEEIENPAIIAGDPILPGFKFDFKEIL
jgi:Uma2 family endonuclease